MSAFSDNRFVRAKQLLSPHVLMDRLELVVDLENSHGSWLRDGETGEDYLDGFTGFASLPIGWNHPGLLEPAFQQELLRVALNKPALSDLYLPEMAEFVDTFHRLALPKSLQSSFYIDGGALALENAFKVAIDWKTRRNRQAGKLDRGDRILSFRQGFHGRSGYTMAVTDSPDPRKVGDYPLFDWPRVENPYIRHPRSAEADAETIEAEARSIAQIENFFHRFPNHIAGIVIEPIQGEGGDNHFRPEFFRKLRQIADERDALLIFDEVQSGMGVTGDWWAHEFSGVTPDIMAFGKKAQVCGIAVNRPRLDLVEGHPFQESSRINSTWGGNLVDMVRVRRVLEIIDQEKLLDRVKRAGKVLMDGLQALSAEDERVCAVRGRGSFIAFDLPTKELRNELTDRCYDEKLLLLGCGTKSIRLRPHLAFTEEEAGELLVRLGKALRRLGRHRGGHVDV